VASAPSTDKPSSPPARREKQAPIPAGNERQRDVRRPRPEYLFL
jgi:hypothetical protein